MARVPYDPVNTVEATGPARQNPGESANPAEFGGLIGQAATRAGGELEQTGSNLGTAAIDIQQRYNQVATDNAFNEYQKGLQNLTFGDPNDPSKPGFYSMHGQTAMDAYQSTANSVDQLRGQISSKLNTAQNIEFQQAARRLQMFTLDSMGRHYDQQFQSFTQNVNESSNKLAVQAVSQDPLNEHTFQNNLQQAQRAAVRQVQTVNGTNAPPDMINAATDTATQNLYKTRALSWGNTDPSGAIDWMKKNQASFAPNDFRMLSNEFQNKKDMNDATGTANDIINGNVPNAPARAIAGAIHGQEGTKPGITSIQGAQSSWQIEPATFKQYAQPGEQLSNEADANAVGHRIISDYTQKYGGDPARVAVAYFSGPGNVAPPGSPTPWKTDNHDGNHFYVSQYVNGVLRRLGQGGNYPTQGETIDANNPAPKLRGITASIPSMSPAAMSALFDDDPALKAKQAATDEQQGASLSPAQPTADIAQAQPGIQQQPAQPEPHNVQLASLDPDAMRLALDQHGAAAYAPQQLPPAPVVMNTQPPAASTPRLQPTQQESPNHNPAAYTAEQQIMENAWATVQQKYPNNAAMQHEVMSQVQDHLRMTNLLQQKYETEQARALHDNQQASGNNIMQTLMLHPDKFDPAMIANDPNLSWEQKDTLWKVAQDHTAAAGNHDTKTYGPGFYQVFQDINRPTGDSQKITDPLTLAKRVGPSGDLTLEGWQKASELISQKGTPEGEANAKIQTQAFKEAYSKISGKSDQLGIKDSKGEELFTNFMAAAYPAIEANQKSGKMPLGQFVKSQPWRDLIGSYQRSEAQKIADMKASAGALTQQVQPPATGAPIASHLITGPLAPGYGQVEGDRTSPAGTPAFSFGAPAQQYNRDALAAEMQRRGLLGKPPQQAQPPQPSAPQ